MNKIKCIYAIKDKRSDKVLYIGQTKNFKQRKYQHFGCKRDKIDNYIFQEGDENFEMYILEELNEDITRSEMYEKEQIYIEKYDTLNNGLNFKRSGNISADWKEYCRELGQTDKYKEKNKKWYENNKEKYQTEEYKKYNREKHRKWYNKNKDIVNEKRRINYQKKKQEKLNIETL